MDNPLSNNWFLDVVLKGIKRDKAHPPVRKLPITPTILLGIKRLLDINKPADIMFWAACVVAFFGFFRKSNLLPRSTVDRGYCLTRGDIRRSEQGLMLRVSRSKTIQFHQREYLVPLIYIRAHPLCLMVIPPASYTEMLTWTLNIFHMNVTMTTSVNLP